MDKLLPHQRKEYERIHQFENEVILVGGGTLSTTVGWLSSLFGKTATICTYLNDHATVPAQNGHKNFMQYNRCFNLQCATPFQLSLNPYNYDQQPTTLIVVPSNDFDNFRQTLAQWCPNCVVSSWKTFSDVKYNFPVSERTFKSADASPELFANAIAHKHVDILMISCSFLLGYKKHLAKLFWNRIVIKKGFTHEPLRQFTNRVMSGELQFFPTNFVWLIDRFPYHTVGKSPRGELDQWSRLGFVFREAYSHMDFLDSIISSGFSPRSIMIQSPIQDVMHEHGSIVVKNTQRILDPKKHLQYIRASDVFLNGPTRCTDVSMQHMIVSRRWLDILGNYLTVSKTQNFQQFVESHKERMIVGLERFHPRFEKSLEQARSKSIEVPEEFSCPVCLETDRTKVMLSCFHFVCAECCVRLSLQKNNGWISCPCCRSVTTNTPLSHAVVCEADILHETTRIQDLRSQEMNLSFTSVKEVLMGVVQSATFKKEGEAMFVIGPFQLNLPDRVIQVEHITSRADLFDQILRKKNPIFMAKNLNNTMAGLVSDSGVEITHVVYDASTKEDLIHFAFAEKHHHMILTEITNQILPPSSHQME